MKSMRFPKARDSASCRWFLLLAAGIVVFVAQFAAADGPDQLVAYQKFSRSLQDWWTEGGRSVQVAQGHLLVDADPPDGKTRSACTVWFRRELPPGDVRIEYDAHVVSSAIGANNINCFLCYSDPLGRPPLSQSRDDRADGAYKKYHGMNGYIITFLRDRDFEGGKPPDGSAKARVRIWRYPGFELLAEIYAGAFWYADFIRRQADAEICLLPRKALYDEHDSFAAGKVDVERLFACFNDRYVIKATVRGADLLKFLVKNGTRDRFNPFHHRGRPYSGDAIFYSGFDVAFRPETKTVEFGIDPKRTYTLAVPWPFTRKDTGRYRFQLPPRQIAEQADPIPGLRLDNPRVLLHTAREVLVQEGTTKGLDFHARFPEPRPDWAPWTEYFEAELKAH